jgi:hypothetical protein
MKIPPIGGSAPVVRRTCGFQRRTPQAADDLAAHGGDCDRTSLRRRAPERRKSCLRISNPGNARLWSRRSFVSRVQKGASGEIVRYVDYAQCLPRLELNYGRHDAPIRERL